MINSQEFIALIDARCNLAIRSSNKYRELEKKLSGVLKNIDKKSASQIDEIISAQQALVEELIYKQGIKDALSLVN